MLRRLFSRRVSYAAHVLCLLAQREPLSAIPLTELASQMARAWPGTSATYLSKVVQTLVQCGILVSLRGQAGGYGFARLPAEVSLWDIVRALEGPLEYQCPLTPAGPCRLHEQCGNCGELMQLERNVAELLAQVTIDRLSRNLPLGGLVPADVWPASRAAGDSTATFPPLPPPPPFTPVCPPVVLNGAAG